MRIRRKEKTLHDYLCETLVECDQEVYDLIANLKGINVLYRDGGQWKLNPKWQLVLKKCPELVEDIRRHTLRNRGATLRERLAMVIQNRDPYCDHCKRRKLTLRKSTGLWPTFCSVSCARQSKYPIREAP